MDRSWRLLVTEPLDGPTNMAVDEALLRSRVQALRSAHGSLLRLGPPDGLPRVRAAPRRDGRPSAVQRAGHRAGAPTHGRERDSPRVARARGDLQRGRPGRRLHGRGRRAGDVPRGRSGARRRARAARDRRRARAARPGSPRRDRGARLLFPAGRGLRDLRRRPEAGRQCAAPPAWIISSARRRPLGRRPGAAPRGVSRRGRPDDRVDHARPGARAPARLRSRSWRRSPPASPRRSACRSCREVSRPTRARWWTRWSPRSTARRHGRRSAGCQLRSGPHRRRPTRPAEERRLVDGRPARWESGMSEVSWR